MENNREHAAYTTILTGGEGRYEEKKSIFIATVRSVSTEEEAVTFVDEMKKKYWDARHNCFAYVLGAKGGQMRASDDGEPQGTAGRPILDVLTGNGITDALIVVTRYFGGTLLGTGGLVRAYTAAARDGIANSRLVKRIYGARLELVSDYTDIGRVQYLLANQGVAVLNSEYADCVKTEIVIPAETQDRLVKELTNATAGRIRINEIGFSYYGEADGEIIL